MLSFRVVTILSMLFALASLMPGKKFLVETDDADAAADPDFESYIDELMKEYDPEYDIPKRAPRRGLNKGQPRCGTCNNPGGNPNTPRPHVPNQQHGIPQPRIGR